MSSEIVCKRQFISDEEEKPHNKDEQPVRLTPIRVDGKIFIGSGEDANIIAEQAS